MGYRFIFFFSKNGPEVQATLNGDRSDFRKVVCEYQLPETDSTVYVIFNVNQLLSLINKIKCTQTRNTSFNCRL